MTTDERLGRIDTRLANLEKHLLGNGQPGACEGHSRRLRKLEAWRSYITGAVAMLGVLVLGCLVPIAAGWWRWKPWP
jgi:membrane protein YqaA with SNARE-associated domain